MNRFAWVVVAFFLLIGFLAVGLTLDPKEVPSPLIGKQAPDFSIPQLHAAEKVLSPREMQGKVWLLNVWASWCVSCREEHPVLLRLAKQQVLPVIGLNYKDQREDALRWLAQFGDPYTISVADRDGRVGIDYGVYGVPETFIIDKAGIIRHKHIGPITQEVLDETIVPLIKQLQK